MKLYHGVQHYAVHSRDIGSMGGRMRQPTVKIYESRRANMPAIIISDKIAVREFKAKIEAAATRNDRQAVLESYLPVEANL